MHNPRTIRSRYVRHPLAAVLLLAAAAGVAAATETQTWSENEYADFQKGIIKSLSVRSDGMLALAPAMREILDSSSAYLWAVASDSKGNVYAGGGPTAKLYRIAPNGDKKTVAELEGLEIQAIAIDKRDRIYVATSPDGKVYRISGNSKPEVFFTPKSKYIWALAVNSRGELLVATGDPGEVHVVAPDGKARLLFKTDETHARSMAVDAHDNVILGTDPSGLVIRVSPSGEGFVLYQMDKKEVTAVAVAADGSVWAAGVGGKQPGPRPPVMPVPAPSVVGPTAASMGPHVGQVQVHAAPPPASLSPNRGAITGGSEVYRIDSSGYPEKMWSDAQEIVYTIAFDSQGHALLGTGNKGFIYRIDSATLYTALLNAAPTQITELHPGPGGRLLAATGNVGKVFEIGPGLAPSGSIESDVFDAGIFSNWGRLSYEGKDNGGKIAIEARSGNLDQPQKNWSPWSPAITDPKGARIPSPAARFVQWRATLSGSGNDRSPELREVEIAYLPRNVAPRIEVVEITPPNYKFPTPNVMAVNATRTLNLPPLGKQQRPTNSLAALSNVENTPAMQYAKGWVGARWLASDENGDTLCYEVEIRGVHETQWKVLKDKVKEKYLSWDSTTFPDGEYVLRVIASDLPSNPPQQTLTSILDSDTFTIDNTPPVISGLTAARSGAQVTVSWKAADALNDIDKAEYSLDGGEWTIVAPVGALSDSHTLDYTLTLDHVPAGEHTVAVRVNDAFDNQGTAKTVVH